MSSKPIRIPLT
jgi:hypothetical protein